LIAASALAATLPSDSIAQDTPILVANVGFALPESVLHDPDADVYLVANINGAPLDADDNGFISRITPEGKILALKWIEGGQNGVQLDAPKGMAISGGVLWVADISVVRRFDAKTGRPLGEVKINGATFLNDVAATADGEVIVSDGGLTAKFEPSGTDAIYLVDRKGTVRSLARSEALGRPNGRCVRGERLHGRVGRGPAERLRPPPPRLPVKGRDGHEQAAEKLRRCARAVRENDGPIADRLA
jgi:sugar lactone lactonase YvrE